MGRCHSDLVVGDEWGFHVDEDQHEEMIGHDAGVHCEPLDAFCPNGGCQGQTMPLLAHVLCEIEVHGS